MEKYLVIIIGIIILYYLHNCWVENKIEKFLSINKIKEGFADAVTVDGVDDNNAINILAKVAKDLQEGGGLKVKGNLLVDGQLNNTHANIVKGPIPNRYIFHTPDDNRKGMWIVPAKDDAASDWLWGGGLNLNRNGNHTLGGNLTTGNIVSNVINANDNISVNNGTNEGGRIRILNSLKNGKAGQTADWSIWNMTGGYGNKLAFWRYNGDGNNAGPALMLNDDGIVDIPKSLVVSGRDILAEIDDLKNRTIKNQDPVIIRGRSGMLDNWNSKCGDGDEDRDIGVACNGGVDYGVNWKWRIEKA